MRELFIFVAHFLVTLAKLMRPGGVRSVAAESLLLKHQLIILNRSQKRAPNLTPWDRLLMGFTAGFVCPKRLSKIAVNPKAQTCLRFHQAFIRLKYYLLLFAAKASSALVHRLLVTRQLREEDMSNTEPATTTMHGLNPKP